MCVSMQCDWCCDSFDLTQFRLHTRHASFVYTPDTHRSFTIRFTETTFMRLCLSSYLRRL